MKFLFLLLPFSFLGLSLFNSIRYKKLINTGKIPHIIAAQRNKTLFLVLALTITYVFFLVLGYEA